MLELSAFKGEFLVVEFLLLFDQLFDILLARLLRQFGAFPHIVRLFLFTKALREAALALGRVLMSHERLNLADRHFKRY